MSFFCKWKLWEDYLFLGSFRRVWWLAEFGVHVSFQIAVYVSLVAALACAEEFGPRKEKLVSGSWTGGG